jgi:hypothetical protein
MGQEGPFEPSRRNDGFGARAAERCTPGEGRLRVGSGI